MSTPLAVPPVTNAPLPDPIPGPSNRHLVLIDLENMAATSSPTARDAEAVRARLRLVIPDFDTVQRIVACSHHAAGKVAFAFPGARHLWRSGRNGADLALLDVLENEHVAQRFGRVTLCSGDGIFAASVAGLGGADVDVTVVAWRGRLARALELAARYVVWLPVTGWLSGTEDAS